MAFQQYRQIIEQFKAERSSTTPARTEDYQPEDIYEPEMALDEDGSKLEHVSTVDYYKHKN